MYECPNCNGTMDPYLYQKEKDALESQFYDVTVFSCPQCGGGHRF